MPFGGYKDFDDCVAQNQDKSDPEAYCAVIKQKTESRRHADFQRIHREFCNYYCKDGSTPCYKGEFEYYTWLRALNLDESLPYGQAYESFRWTKDKIQFYKEDTNNKYYKILVGFPTKSMNGNVYRESDLLAMTHTLIGVHPNLNHKSNIIFKNTEFVGAKYEDGATEAILRVNKNELCPICGPNKRLYQLIDEKKIVNVSLEGACRKGDPYTGKCVGFEYTGCALLTTDVLPGIPMARIFPLESYMPRILRSPHITIGERRMKIKVKGLDMKEQEMPENQLCPEGQKWNVELGKCMPVEVPQPMPTFPPEGTDVSMGVPAASDDSTEPTDTNPPCEPGMHRNEGGICVPDESPSPAESSIDDTMNSNVSDSCPEGYHKDAEGNCVPDEPMTEQEEEPEEEPCPDGYHRNDEGECIPDDSTSERIKRLKAEQTTRNLKFANTKISEQYNKLSKNYHSLLGIRKSQTQQINKLEKTVDSLNNEKIADATTLKSYTRRLEDMTNNRDFYKKELEDLTQKHEILQTKYKNQLSTNLELSKKQTQSNEDWLQQAKENERLKEALKKAKRLSKNIIKVKV